LIQCESIRNSVTKPGRFQRVAGRNGKSEFPRQKSIENQHKKGGSRCGRHVDKIHVEFDATISMYPKK